MSEPTNDDWAQRKLRSALFDFFLWSLPPNTSGVDLIELTDILVNQAKAKLSIYRVDRKRIEKKVNNAAKE